MATLDQRSRAQFLTEFGGRAARPTLERSVERAEFGKTEEEADFRNRELVPREDRFAGYTCTRRFWNEMLVASVAHHETCGPDVESTSDDPISSTFLGQLSCAAHLWSPLPGSRNRGLWARLRSATYLWKGEAFLEKLFSLARLREAASPSCFETRALAVQWADEERKTLVLGIKQASDLFNRDATVVGAPQRHETGSIRRRIVEPFGARPPIGSTDDQHVGVCSLILRDAPGRMSVGGEDPGHRLSYRRKRRDRLSVGLWTTPIRSAEAGSVTTVAQIFNGELMIGRQFDARDLAV